MEIEIGAIVLENEIEIGPIELDIQKLYPKLENLEVTPSGKEQNFKSANYYGYDEVTVIGDKNLIEDNIKKGVQIFNVEGTLEGLDTTDATATAEDILNSQTAYVNGEKITGTMVDNGAVIINPTTENQYIANGFHNGEGYVSGDVNLLAENIKKDTSIFSITGTYLSDITETTEYPECLSLTESILGTSEE